MRSNLLKKLIYHFCVKVDKINLFRSKISLGTTLLRCADLEQILCEHLVLMVGLPVGPP